MKKIITFIVASASLAFASEYGIPPEKIQQQAFSLSGKIVPMMTIQQPKWQEIEPGVIELNWSGGITATVPASLMPAINRSKMLYVKVIEPDATRSKVEIIGNGKKASGLDLSICWK